MTNLFTYLLNLLSLSLGSPCTDVSLDRRLTVGSSSGRYCSGLMRLVFIFAILLTVGVGNAWGDAYTLITSNSSLSNGDKVVIATINGSGDQPGTTGVTGWNGTKDATISSTTANWVQYTVSSASSDGWKLYDSSAKKYIADPESSNQFLYDASGYLCAVDGSGHMKCHGRYLCANGSNYRFYASVGSYTAFYVWKVTAGSAGGTDNIVATDLAATNTTYTVFSNVSKPSGAVYAGKSAKTAGGAIQMNNTSPNAIVSTASGGYITKVTITWNSSTITGRTIDVYGKTTAYSGSSDLWDNSNKGTKLGSIVYGTSTELTITGSYTYIGIRPNDGALYVDKISIEWSLDPPGCSATPSITGAALNGGFNAGGVTSLSNISNVFSCTGSSVGSGCSYSENGFVWSTTASTASDLQKGKSGVTYIAGTTPNASGAFTGTLSGTWTAGTTYYYRAYVKNDGDNVAYYPSSGVNSFIPRSVTFNSNGGTSVDTKYVRSGGTVTAPTAPTKVGHTFAGWYTDEDLTDAVSWNSTISSNVTYYAKWTNTYANTVYTLVEDLYELDNNKKIIIMNTGHTEALSTTQQDKNRTAVAYNASGNAGFAMSNSDKTATLASATTVQVITLKSTATTDVYQLNVENGYLRAAGNSTSYLLKTYGSTPDSYCNFLFSLSSGNFSVVGQGDNDNKNIKYNSGSHLFSGYGDSQNAILVYVEQSSSVATPTFSPAAGTYGSTQSVSISCGTAGATIYYTTDGTEPTRSSSAYSSAISVTTNTTIKAKAFKRGMHASETASATYNIRCATPSFSPVAGTYSSTQNVSLSCATAGATIYYTTDGSDPNESSSVYSSAISVSVNTTIKAIAVKSGMANSTIGTATFNIRCAQPTFSPTAGTMTGAQNITINAVTGATIYYTTDGSDPDESSDVYSSAIPISASTTIKAIAVKSGMANSEIASATYTLQFNITWKVNGVAWTPHDPDSDPDDGKVNGSSLVNYGTAWSALTLPSDPDAGDYCGQKFVGWTTTDLEENALDKGDDAAAITALNLMNSSNQSTKTGTTISGATTFYAVFADYTTD